MHLYDVCSRAYMLDEVPWTSCMLRQLGLLAEHSKSIGTGRRTVSFPLRCFYHFCSYFSALCHMGSWSFAVAQIAGKHFRGSICVFVRLETGSTLGWYVGLSCQMLFPLLSHSQLQPKTVALFWMSVTKLGRFVALEAFSDLIESDTNFCGVRLEIGN